MDNALGITPVNLGPAGIGQTRNTIGADGTAPVQQEQGIADVVTQTGADFVSTLQKAEATSVAGIKGDASAYEVATSVMEAEQALRMTVAVRDRVVQAYLEISRMQI